jgi:type IV pilus assembly protein PilC
MRQERTRLLADAMLLKVPVFGTLNRKLQLARFARTLGSLLSGGVKIVYAMNTAVAATTNAVFARQIREVTEKIIKGMPLAAAMREGDYFTEMMINMVAVGEATARMPQMLMEIADMYDQESETAINSMTAMLGPALIVFLGLMIGFVVLAILLPIFQTSSMIG